MMLPTIHSHWTGTSAIAYDHPIVGPKGTLVPNSVEFVEFPTEYEGKRCMVLCVMLDGKVVGLPISH